MPHRSTAPAPARRTARVGAWLIIPIILGGGCDRVGPAGDEGPRVIELAHDTIHLEAGRRLAEVRVERTDRGDFHPARVEAAPGDYVRFTAGDGGGHAIVFPEDRLTPQASEFLARTGQLRSPPLIQQGASWVITLEDAPTGAYPFRCTTHNAAGELTVAPR
ncbi:MAG TPA: plastocyanin/azurin family copper-binding protein [Longimicrobiales bacterium]|nr:plastocyanin/azurin family copper-binding protein [Longimicrobiales bacterium]